MPGSPEERARYAELQRRLPQLFTRAFLDRHAPQTIVVIPSLTLDLEELKKLVDRIRMMIPDPMSAHTNIRSAAARDRHTAWSRSWERRARRLTQPVLPRLVKRRRVGPAVRQTVGQAVRMQAMHRRAGVHRM